MQPLTTVKTLWFRENYYYIEEFETDSYERYKARLKTFRASWNEQFLGGIDSKGEVAHYGNYHSNREPVIEPMRTWLLGEIEGNVIEVSIIAIEFLNALQSPPLTEIEVAELCDHLREM